MNTANNFFSYELKTIFILRIIETVYKTIKNKHMKILILGSGGREHAMAWQIHQRSKHKVFITPGNPGTLLCGTNLNFKITEFEKIGTFCMEQKIDMVIVGPEEPLVKGVWDYFKSVDNLKQIHFIGASQQGAQLEGSKSFAKSFMQHHGIPTATYREFTADNFDEGVHYLKHHSLPVVLKADGLAAGKGVVICASHQEAIDAFSAMILQSKFGDAGKKW